MRLLNTTTLQLAQFYGEPFPEYAILSHRWGEEEVTFQELEAGTATNKSGYQKIVSFCKKARERGFSWCWVDTCGIDKTSSAELSEAINSMYKWYANSAVCFAYLQDVQGVIQSDESSEDFPLKKSCWFSRGWTLQELIAPRSVEFYNADWIRIGDKQSLPKQLSSITAISERVLLGKTPVRACSVANIMSWASLRVTTRTEDFAYCLMGLFNIHMPLLYGEGSHAFTRLQEELLKQSSDQSLFAWNPMLAGSVNNPVTDDRYCGILAPSPACFADASDIAPLPGYWNTESALTNRGIRLRMPLKQYDTISKSLIGILLCVSQSSSEVVAIEFQASSNSIEDHVQLVRRPLPVKLGDWLSDQQVQLNTVYLVTDTTLWHIRRFGPRFLKPEYYFGIFLEGSDEFTDSKNWGPSSDRSGVNALRPFMGFKSFVGYKANGPLRLLVILDSVHSVRNFGGVFLPTKLSQDINLRFGLDTLQNGLLDMRKPRASIIPTSKRARTERIAISLNTNEEREDVSEIIIDKVRIRVDVFQEEWWASTIRNAVVISFRRLNSVASRDAPDSQHGDHET